MSKPPVLVCGLARCGTSLMMKMLHVGGMEPFADNRSAYEAESLGFSRNMRQMLPLLRGKCAKILDPHMPSEFSDWPEVCDADVIWMSRDAKEQAKSQLKFLRTCGMIGASSQAWKIIAKSLPPDERLCLANFERMGCRIHEIRFESLLKAPDSVAVGVAKFLELDLDTVTMPSVVLFRSAKCAPDCSIEAHSLMAEHGGDL